MTAGGLLTDTETNEWGDELMMNDHSENDIQMRNVSQVKRLENWQKLEQTDQEEKIGQREMFWV